MALPMIAAGIAARAIAKKLATRAAGGITGAGAKSVNPVYRNQTNQIQKNSVKVKQTQKQMDDAMYAENDKALKSWVDQTSKQMWDGMTSGENFSKVKKINSNPMRGK
jgi:hypothetical protein